MYQKALTKLLKGTYNQSKNVAKRNIKEVITLRLWLTEFRESEGFTHEQVADESNISRSYYTNIERGTKTPTVKVAKAIGKTLGFPWEYFFSDECSIGKQNKKRII